jgi:hypothetical protein
MFFLIKSGDLENRREGKMKILGFDIIDAAGIAVVSSYLTAVVLGSMSSGKSTAGLVLSIFGKLVRGGLTKVDSSLQNYIEEKDEEIIEKMKVVKKTGVHREVNPIKDKDESSNKYEIFM